MASTTPGERKALLFIGFVAALGMGARFAQARRHDRPPAPMEVRALERQLAVVESVSGMREAGRGKRDHGPKKRRGREAPRRTSDSTAREAPRISRHASPIPTPVDLDRASVAELERLPGIGPALARRIVANRDSLGPFGSLAALDRRVSGVGPALVRRIEGYVTFSVTSRPTDGTSSAGSNPPGRSPPRFRARRWPPERGGPVRP